METVSNERWQQQLEEAAYKKGQHIPAHWEVNYEEGEGCFPGGWYLSGIGANGFPCSYPMRHEYGPFDTKAAAHAYTDAVWMAIARVNAAMIA